MKKQINQSDIASNISRITGFTKKDVLKVLRAENEIYESAIAQGYSIKNHKLYRLELEHRDERKGYDGLNDNYYTLPERMVVKFKPLSRLNNALEELNKKEDEED